MLEVNNQYLICFKMALYTANSNSVALMPLFFPYFSYFNPTLINKNKGKISKKEL